jgi:hypothetical protein
MKRVHRFRGADATLYDIVKLAPVNPVEKGASPSLFLIVQSFLNDLPARFPVIETDKGKAIEDELFAHGAPLRDVLGGDLESRKTGPLKSPWPLQWDRGVPA